MRAAVVDLLDYDVRFGQGFLFAPPRPVRPEVQPASGAGTTGTPAELNGTARPGAVDAPAIDPPPRVTGNAALARRLAGPA